MWSIFCLHIQLLHTAGFCSRSRKFAFPNRVNSAAEYFSKLKPLQTMVMHLFSSKQSCNGTRGLVFLRETYQAFPDFLSYTHWPHFQLHLFNYLLTHISNQPIKWHAIHCIQTCKLCQDYLLAFNLSIRFGIIYVICVTLNKI